MIIAFVTSITLLPALLTVLNPPGEAAEVGYRALVPVDHFVAPHRRMILALSGIVMIAGLPLLKDLKFDFNPLNLRSPKVESVVTLLEPMKDPASAPDTLEILTPSITAAGELAQRLNELPEVSHTLTLQSFIPKSQDEKLPIIADDATLLGPTLTLLSRSRLQPTRKQSRLCERRPRRSPTLAATMKRLRPLPITWQPPWPRSLVPNPQSGFKPRTP